jgi:hypothetical protein
VIAATSAVADIAASLPTGGGRAWKYLGHRLRKDIRVARLKVEATVEGHIDAVATAAAVRHRAVRCATTHHHCITSGDGPAVVGERHHARSRPRRHRGGVGHALAHYAFPAEHRRQVWSTNSLERLNKEVLRRCDVVGIFPSRQSQLRLTGALLEEQNDEWAVGRRYFSTESMNKLYEPSQDEVVQALLELQSA